MANTIDLHEVASKLETEEAEHSSAEITLDELLEDAGAVLCETGFRALGVA